MTTPAPMTPTTSTPTTSTPTTEPARTPPVVRAGLLAVLAVAAFAEAWGLNRDPLETYYAASVRAMATSWHAFWFGAVDPLATVTMDKLPGSFWVQALAVRLLGPAPWVMVLPQVVEAVGTVAALFVAVRTLVGPRAGLLAAAVLAVSPAAVALARGNVADPLMLLLLTLAVAATARALRPGSRGPVAVLLAGLAVGIAFQAKMIEAWLVLPALALAVLVAAPGTLRRRVLVTVSGGVVAAVVSLAWVVVVDLLPATGRPAVDGTSRNSLLEQTFVYNGFGRLGAQNPLQVLSGKGLALTVPGLAGAAGPPGWTRLFVGPLGRETGWLLPLAVLALVGGLWACRGRPRTDPLRAAYLLLGAWLVVVAVAISVGAVVNVYYAASIAPPLAGLVATGAAHLWRVRHRRAAWGLAAAAMTITVAYGVVLAVGAHTDPLQARAAIVASGVAVVAALVALAAALPAARPGRAPRLVRTALVAGVVAVLVVPLTASAGLVALGRGSFDTPFEAPAQTAAVRGLFVAIPREVARALPGLERARGGAPILMAAQSSAVASVFALPSGEEVLPIGGFTGAGPTPTVDQVRDDVARGRYHLVVAFPAPDPRVAWLAAHCPSPHRMPPPLVDFYCVPADAR